MRSGARHGEHQEPGGVQPHERQLAQTQILSGATQRTITASSYSALGSFHLKPWLLRLSARSRLLLRFHSTAW